MFLKVGKSNYITLVREKTVKEIIFYDFTSYGKYQVKKKEGKIYWIVMPVFSSFKATARVLEIMCIFFFFFFEVLLK